MTFQDSISTCLRKYADFYGRASRPEYWWFALFAIAGNALLSTVSRPLAGIFALGMLVPSLAAASRRLHDTGRSGWWQLISVVPVIGIIVLIVFLAQEGTPAVDAWGRPARD